MALQFSREQARQYAGRLTPPASFKHSMMVFIPKVDALAVRPDQLCPLA
jgi:hypothetical protein